MSTHKGEHPRMGATDVCPLVPIQTLLCKKLLSGLKKTSKKGW